MKDGDETRVRTSRILSPNASRGALIPYNPALPRNATGIIPRSRRLRDKVVTTKTATRLKEADGNGRAAHRTEPTERELRTAPIKPLFARYAAITFAGMLAQMVMVVLEGLIIGNGLGPLGLAAVTVILPLELLNLALGGALGMGTAAAAGQRLGSGDTAGAQKVFNQGFWLAAYLLVALSAAIALFAPQIATMLGATPDIHDDVTAFIRLLMCFYPFCILGQMMGSVLRVDEKPGWPPPPSSVPPCWPWCGCTARSSWRIWASPEPPCTTARPSACGSS